MGMILMKRVICFLLLSQHSVMASTFDTAAFDRGTDTIYVLDMNGEERVELRTLAEGLA